MSMFEKPLAIEIALIPLEASLAEIDAKLEGLSSTDLGPGDKLIWRRYYRHQRRKILLRIQLHRQEQEIRVCELKYKFSQGAGAAKNYKKSLQMLNQGRALGRSRETSLPTPPWKTAKTALDDARAQHAQTLGELEECSAIGGEFKELIDGMGFDPEASVPKVKIKKVALPAADSFDEVAGKMMAEARPVRSKKKRLPATELERILRRLDAAGVKPIDHLGREFREKLADWNQKHSRTTGPIKTFVAAHANPRFRRGVMKCLFNVEKKYKKRHLGLSTE